MKLETKQQVADAVRQFRLPRYHEIPDVGLYLEQTAKYISGFLAPLEEDCVTSSMISNYVKKHLIESPVKKQYGREQIAYLIFIFLAKNVLSLDALRGFMALQRRTYTLEVAYNYFCRQLEAMLQFTFELTDTLEMAGEDSSDEKRLFYSCIVAIVQKFYLEKCLEAIAAEDNQ